MGWTGMLTKQGKDMSAGLYGKKITFTACRCGYTNEQLTETSTIIPIKDMEILEADYKNGRTCVSTRLTNDGIKEVTNVNQIGLYAKLEGEEEKLFYIWQTGETVVLGKEDVLKIKDYDLYLTVSSLGNAIIEVNISNYLRKEHDNDTEAHQDIRTDVANIIDELDLLKSDYKTSKKSLSDGKNYVADCITQKGVATSGEASFKTMGDNVLSISSGTEINNTQEEEITLSEAVNKGDVLVCKYSRVESVTNPIYSKISGYGMDKCFWSPDRKIVIVCSTTDPYIKAFVANSISSFTEMSVTGSPYYKANQIIFSNDSKKLIYMYKEGSYVKNVVLNIDVEQKKITNNNEFSSNGYLDMCVFDDDGLCIYNINKAGQSSAISIKKFEYNSSTKKYTYTTKIIDSIGSYDYAENGKPVIFKDILLFPIKYSSTPKILAFQLNVDKTSATDVTTTLNASSLYEPYKTENVLLYYTASGYTVNILTKDNGTIKIQQIGTDLKISNLSDNPFYIAGEIDGLHFLVISINTSGGYTEWMLIDTRKLSDNNNKVTVIQDRMLEGSTYKYHEFEKNVFYSLDRFCYSTVYKIKKVYTKFSNDLFNNSRNLYIALEDGTSGQKIKAIKLE